MKILVFMAILICEIYATMGDEVVDSTKSSIVETSVEESAQNPQTAESKDSQQSIEDSSENSAADSSDLIDYEFEKHDSKDFLQSLFDRFQVDDEMYVLPLYYSFSTPGYFHDTKRYSRYEMKLQISFKTLIWRDMFYDVGLYFAYTHTAFFQIYSKTISSPVRDTDMSPTLAFYRPLDWGLFGGKFYNLRFGYNHTSNGEGGLDRDEIKRRSRSRDTIFGQLNYRVGDFDMGLKVWAYISARPNNIKQYVGYSSLRLSYRLGDSNFILDIGNLVHNYAKYKGNVRLHYRYDLPNGIGIYAQYFYGYGDNLYQYNKKTQNIGIGVAVAH